MERPETGQRQVPASEMSGTILIVDGGAQRRRTLAERLARRGWRVLEGDSLEAASRAAHGGCVEVALLDLQSLGNVALLALQAVREGSPDAEVILLTGKSQLPLVIRGMKLGAFDDVQVPVDVEVLLDKAEAALARSREKHRGPNRGAPADPGAGKP